VSATVLSFRGSRLHRPPVRERAARCRRPLLTPTSEGFAGLTVALLALALLFFAPDGPSAPPQAQHDSTPVGVEVAHHFTAGAPWVGGSARDPLRTPLGSPGLTTVRVVEPLLEGELPGLITAQASDRALKVRDLSSAVHPDRIHAPPFHA
jgi:hypothetical protein